MQVEIPPMTPHGRRETVASRRVGSNKGRINGWKFRLTMILTDYQAPCHNR